MFCARVRFRVGYAIAEKLLAKRQVSGGIRTLFGKEREEVREQSK
jgi:hypothetical protein